MASTPFHDQDDFNPVIQKDRDSTEISIYGASGGVATDENIQRLFSDGFERPRNSAIAHDVLKTDRWKMKGSMVSFAHRVGTDHGTISKWYTRGVLPPWLERFLAVSPNRPTDWEAPIKKVFNAQHRHAFMFVASYLERRLHVDSPGTELRAIDTELLFDILHLEDRDRWEASRQRGDLAMAAEVVESVCDPSDRQIMPFWLTKRKATAVAALVNRLRRDHRFAFEYICDLERRWRGVFILTRAATRGMGWLP